MPTQTPRGGGLVPGGVCEVGHGDPDLFTKAAALLHSLARNHPLVDGNERLAWLATYVLCAQNGVELDPDDDAAYDLVIAVGSGLVDEIEEIAATLTSFVRTVA